MNAIQFQTESSPPALRTSSIYGWAAEDILIDGESPRGIDEFAVLSLPPMSRILHVLLLLGAADPAFGMALGLRKAAKIIMSGARGRGMIYEDITKTIGNTPVSTPGA